MINRLKLSNGDIIIGDRCYFFVNDPKLALAQQDNFKKISSKKIKIVVIKI